jgi:hypothetical protein
LGAGTEGSSPERHPHDGAVEAVGLTGVRPEERWVAPVVGLESIGNSRLSSWMCMQHRMMAKANCPWGGARQCMTQRGTCVERATDSELRG